MDDREAEERADHAPLPEHVEPTGEAEPSMVGSTRESGESQFLPPAGVQTVDETPIEASVQTDGAAQAPAAEDSVIPSGQAGEPATMQAGADAPLASIEAASESQPAQPAADEVTEDAAEPVLDEASSEPAAAEAPEIALATVETESPEGPAQTPAQEHRAAAAEGLRRGRLPQGEVPVEGGTEPAWYVIHCYSGYENKVRHNLEQRIETMGMKDRIFDVVIPTQEEIEVKEGKRRTVERHIFPGYVLVNMTLSEESWYVVRNTPGVTGFVGMGNLPTPLRPEEVSQIIKRMESDAPAVKVSFKVNERVRIVDGPFNDFRGTVADIDMERTKVRVMVSFFGRETPVELDFLQVEKA